MILAAANRMAGAALVTGVFLFLFAVGTNLLYSYESVCLDIAPPQCYSGFEVLAPGLQFLLMPGLYVVASAVIILGVTLWFKRGPIAKEPRA
jgi:hypothetical protein